MDISVRIPVTGETITVRMAGSDTIETVRNKIEERYGVFANAHIAAHSLAHILYDRHFFGK